MANYEFISGQGAAQNRTVPLNAYVAQLFTTAHVVTDTSAFRIRAMVASTGANTIRLGLWMGNGPSATLHSETEYVYTTATATTLQWIDHIFPTKLVPADLAGKAFEIRIRKTAGTGTFSFRFNQEGYSLAGSRFVSTTTMAGGQTTVSNAVGFFGIMETREARLSGNLAATDFTTISNTGTGTWEGGRFNAPWHWDRFITYVSSSGSTTNATLRVYNWDTNALVATGSTTSPTTAGSSAIHTWSATAATARPPGEYYYTVTPNSGSIRLHTGVTAGAIETRGLYSDGQIIYPRTRGVIYQITENVQASDAAAGVQVRRWNGSAWVPAIITKWNGSQWAPTTLTKY